MTRHILGIAAGLVLLCGVPVPALAHAVVLSTEPADGAILEVAPEEARVVFNETIELLSVQIVEPGGAANAVDATLTNGTIIVAPLPPDLSSGTHALSWRVISSDGHPLSGSIIFSIGAPSGAIDIDSRDWLLSAAIWIVRALFYVGLFIGAGGAAFAGWAGMVPVAARKYVWLALGAGLASAILGVGLQGADALGLGIGGIFDGSAWIVGPAAGFGPQVTIGAVTMMIAALSLSSREPKARLLVAMAIIGSVGASIATTGHASTADPQWLTRPAAFVHAAAIAFWIGSLLPLACLLRDGALEPLRRFSQIIPFAVLALLVSGTALVAVQLGSPSTAWISAYGLVLVAKLALVAAILALALRNRYVLTGRTLAGDDKAAQKLRRAVLAETALVLLVFLTVAAWRFTPPPRALAEADFVPAPAFAHAMRAEAMADMALEPSANGDAGLTLMLWDAAQMPLAAREVSVRLSEPLLGIEPFRRAAQSEGNGLWRVPDIDLPAPGLWKVEVEILVSDFVSLTLEGELQVGAE